MDAVILRGVRCAVRVGVSPEERRIPQECVVDVEMGLDLSRAARSDDVQDTADYGKVFEQIQALARDEEFALLEKFAGRLEEELRQTARFEQLVIRVHKTRPPLWGRLEYAGIEIRRP